MENSVNALENLIKVMGEKVESFCDNEPTYQCEYRAMGEVVTASAYSREQAQEIAAQLMLQKIQDTFQEKPKSPQRVSPVQNMVTETNNMNVPGSSASSSTCVPPPVPNYVALLEEFCTRFLLSPVKCDRVQVTGHRFMRQFTVRVSAGIYQTHATSRSENNATQLAAKTLYEFFLGITVSGANNAVINVIKNAANVAGTSSVTDAEINIITSAATTVSPSVSIIVVTSAITGVSTNSTTGTSNSNSPSTDAFARAGTSSATSADSNNSTSDTNEKVHNAYLIVR